MALNFFIFSAKEHIYVVNWMFPVFFKQRSYTSVFYCVRASHC